MSIVFTTTVKGEGTATPELSFAQRTPEEYSVLLLKQAGISDLESLNRLFITDPGQPVHAEISGPRVVLAAGRDEVPSGGWILVERMPGAPQDYARARVFKSFEGAAADFAIKLRIHTDGDVRVTQSETRQGAWQLSFSASGRKMYLAPYEGMIESEST